MNVILTPRCSVSPLTATDSDELIPLYTNAEVRKYLGGVRPLEGVLTGLRHSIQSSTEHPFAVRLNNDNTLIGYIVIAPHHNPADMEISYMFLPEFWGNGYAAETVFSLIDFCRNELKLGRVVAETQTANTRSCSLLEKLRFNLESHVDRFGEDQSIYVLAL